ncbi:hypothetical protein PsYK624_081620 [Phanerochaete sordida]|uniref:Fungal-type protein kinase domain-containing protein n=1 Tax=Phanerochaete sordida TaxID=48140 RepID=A0A9P3GCU4_9APHY|nr:hypothetical protein PsYK624_081620 [Phanerochaete sordida]
MPPQAFLDEFMKAESSAAPDADFSDVPRRDSVKGMCQCLIRAVERFKLCPNLRLFVTKTKKRSVQERTAHSRSSSSDHGLRRFSSHDEPKPIDSHNDADQDDTLDLCPPLAARERPKKRRGTKKKRDTTEYYDFGTALLGIEVHESPTADPFNDPPPHAHPRRLSPSPPQKAGNCTSFPGNSAPSPSRSAAPPPGEGDGAAPPSRAERNVASSHHPEADDIYDTFDDPSEEGTAARRSLLSHAQAQFGRQHRTVLFQLVIVCSRARFIRWDRAGAIVSERFDYVQESELLANFLWRLSSMSDVQRGWDPAVNRASKREATLFREAVSAFVRGMEARSENSVPVRNLPLAERSLDGTGTYPVWKIRVLNELTGDSSSLVVNRPFAGHHSVTGRATRAYIAYDLLQGRLVFMKDSWRDTDPKLLPEFDTYQELREHEVPFIPKVLYGGDVHDLGGQRHETLTHVYADRKNSWLIIDREFDRLVHHRIVQDIAFPLDAVANVREFVQAMHDALCAIDKAYNSAGILHRDVSKRNIMLTADGRGVLNDWDHAGRKHPLAPGIGTWAFMSVELASNPDKLHGILDDLESVFWNLVYGALRRFALPEENTSTMMFEESGFDNQGRATGGTMKGAFLLGRRYVGLRLSSAKLSELIQRCGDCWRQCHLALSPMDGIGERKKNEVREILKDAAKPSYWVDIFAATLRDMPPKGDEVLPSQTSSSEDESSVSASEGADSGDESGGHRAVSLKRKSCDDKDLPPPPTNPRRSKRLKTLPGV